MAQFFILDNTKLKVLGCWSYKNKRSDNVTLGSYIIQTCYTETRKYISKLYMKNVLCYVYRC